MNPRCAGVLVREVTHGGRIASVVDFHPAPPNELDEGSDEVQAGTNEVDDIRRGRRQSAGEWEYGAYTKQNRTENEGNGDPPARVTGCPENSWLDELMQQESSPHSGGSAE